MDPAHPLLEPVRIPRDIVIEHDVAAMQVNPLSCGFSRYENLSGPVPELLLRVEAGSRLLPFADLHPAVDEADSEPPIAELTDKILESLAEFGEDQKPL